MTEPAKRGPGRPRDQQNTERRRRELIAAAYTVFTTKGYAAASTADITAEVGVGYGTFYRYFDSKRAILDEVVDYGLDRLLHEIAGEVFESAPDTTEFTVEGLMRTWVTAVDRMCRIAESDPALMQTLMFELPGIDEELDSRILGLGGILAATVGRFLSRAVDAGVLRSDVDTTEVAWMLLAMTIPPVMRTLRGDGPLDRQTYVATALAVLEPGLRAAQPN
ncbi:TetR/AcrR family transcriptional regulator [Nocardia sp. 2]|uniref:TetR/AcrR family transcriptional regulator n=1 Tax=Nocardia acididurans TaxID=2802282 RepID=A0ABS1MGQ6_9NOCA|nr:TetR/AcrR family transcriptional regulator [Nocardia acididurans]MBL1079850.1 TetR/AcrR family transcriptional regulator [Nocardia acididurans]